MSIGEMISGERMDQRVTVRLTEENVKRIKRIAEKNGRSVNFMINLLIEEEHRKLCDDLSKKIDKGVPFTGDIWY